MSYIDMVQKECLIKNGFVYLQSMENTRERDRERMNSSQKEKWKHLFTKNVQTKETGENKF